MFLLFEDFKVLINYNLPPALPLDTLAISSVFSTSQPGGACSQPRSLIGVRIISFWRLSFCSTHLNSLTYWLKIAECIKIWFLFLHLLYLIFYDIPIEYELMFTSFFKESIFFLTENIRFTDRESDLNLTVCNSVSYWMIYVCFSLIFERHSKTRIILKQDYPYPKKIWNFFYKTSSFFLGIF